MIKGTIWCHDLYNNYFFSQIIFIVMKKRRSHTIQYERGDVLLSNSNYRETEILEEEPEETDNLLFSEPWFCTTDTARKYAIVDIWVFDEQDVCLMKCI